MYNKGIILKPNKNLGQHFLCDEGVLASIAGLVPAGYKQYIEVGPGSGNLTKFLTCSPLTCLELDTRFEAIPGVKWINIDALRYDYNREDYVLGNLPYNISGPLFKKICIDQIEGFTFLVQKEVAERICATSGKDYGRLSVLVQAFFDVQYHFDVSPEAFTPPPRVNSAVITGVRNIKNNIAMDVLDEVCFEIFKHRRKQISSGIRRDIASRLLLAGVPQTARPENIPPEVIWQLADTINTKVT